MATNDTLSNALSKILNAEHAGKSTCTLTPVSKVIKTILQIMNQHKYIGTFEEDTKNNQGIIVTVNLLGNLNKCGSVRPRFSTQLDQFEKWEKRYLPAKGFGLLFVSTSRGIMTHEDAKKQGIGGKLLAYCY